MTGDELQKAIDALIAVERGEQPTASELSGLQSVVHAFLDPDARQLVGELHVQATAIRKGNQRRSKGLVADALVSELMAGKISGADGAEGERLTKTAAIERLASKSAADVKNAARDIWRTLEDSPHKGDYPRLEQLAVTRKALKGND